MKSLALAAGLALSVTVGGSALAQEAVWYRFTREAQLSRGCYDPCDCLLEQATELRGRFLLRPVESDARLARAFAVERFQVRALIGDQPFGLVGAGRLRIAGGDDPDTRTAELRLELRQREGDAEPFASGVVPLDARFPALDLTVSQNGMVCFDTVIRISARPVRRIGDVNADDRVDSDDLALVLGAWGTGHADCDVDCDGFVDATDLVEVLADWDR